jgi:hypothetical protein
MNIESISTQGSANNIKEAILKDLYKNGQEYNSIVLGEGVFGKALVPGFDTHIQPKGCDYKVPVAVKMDKTDGELIISIESADSKLRRVWVHSFNSVIPEILILSFMTDLWMKEESPHLPLMLGYLAQPAHNNIRISAIITELQGLPQPIPKPLKGVSLNALYGQKEGDTTRLITLYQLFDYMTIYDLTELIPLKPHKLIDYICISYLATHHLLESKGVTIYDMHANNIFIHWLNKNSHMGKRSISGIKKIVYSVKSGKEKNKTESFCIETGGIMIKLGDVGGCIIDKKDLSVVGFSVNPVYNLAGINVLRDPKYSPLSFLEIHAFIPLVILKQTVLWRILNSDPYDTISYSYSSPLPTKTISRMLSSYDLLHTYYKKYYVSEYMSDKHVLYV